jgi:hypothetical protein
LSTVTTQGTAILGKVSILCLTEGFGTSRPLQLASVKCKEEHGCLPV